MFMLINCAESIRCAVCHSVTLIADPCGFHLHPHHAPRTNYNPPPAPSAHPPPPPAHGSKRALICGISYWNTPDQLKGCIYDARCMKYMLVNRFRFPESCILMLSEEEPDPLRHPTKHNMWMAMQWLVVGHLDKTKRG